MHEAEPVGIPLAIRLIKTEKTGCTTHAIGVLYVINSVPTGASKDRGPFNPDECHTAPVAMNPSYASLMVSQKPSWVRPPLSYTSGSVSSLVVAFEDRNGSKLRAPLAEYYL